MGETSIEWTEASWNPVRGCSRVSRGCEHCYAEGVARRFAGPGQPYEGLVHLDASGKAKAQWNGVVRVVPEHLADPLRWKRPRRVFVNSMSDLFHVALSLSDIARVFAAMAHAERHTFQVLTKRAKRMREVLASKLFWHDVKAAHISLLGDDLTDDDRDRVANACWSRSLPNVWLGVSVEDQATADERIPHLLASHAALRWVSYEPAIGPMAFRGEWFGRRDLVRGLDWIVVGGESGPGARPFDLGWARTIIAQCDEAGVPVFVKQIGTRPVVIPMELRDRKGGDPSEWPADLRVREWPEVSR